jgi:glycosyltransferase involved in cell wall biosynthesis
MTDRLTVIIPCKDELANIGPCVDSAHRVADEVLIADSGSTDGTLAYVRSRGDCRVIEREYRTSGDFKNWSIPQATHSWVLILDADERVPVELAHEIRSELESSPPCDGYWISRSNHLMGHRVRYTDWGRDKVLRLFRRDLGRYEGPSDHGEVVVAGGNVGRLRAPLDHYTLWSWGTYLKKFDRYTRVQAEQWYASGRQASYGRMLWQPPLRFLRDFVLHRGFLDGAAGLQIAWMSAFYTFMKQARLWELQHGKQQADVEVVTHVSAHVAPPAAASDSEQAA